MRSLTLLFATLALLNACGNAPEAPAAAPVAAAAPSVITVTAQHGGVVMAAEDSWIELVTKQDGQVEAYVVDQQGQALTAEASASLNVNVQGNDGAAHPVQLAWDAERRAYAGHAQVTLVEGPADVQFVATGRPARRARTERVIIIPAPVVEVRAERPAVRAQVQVEAPDAPQVVVTPPAARVELQRPAGRIVIQQPNVQVQAGVNVAAPRVGVTVRAPQPPSAQVVVTAPPPPRASVRVQAAAPAASASASAGGSARASASATPPRASVQITAPPPPSVRIQVPAPPSVDVRVRAGH